MILKKPNNVVHGTGIHHMDLEEIVLILMIFCDEFVPAIRHKYRSIGP
jgi:hypothetical protein